MKKLLKIFMFLLFLATTGLTGDIPFNNTYYDKLKVIEEWDRVEYTEQRYYEIIKIKKGKVIIDTITEVVITTYTKRFKIEKSDRIIERIECFPLTCIEEIFNEETMEWTQ